MESNEVTENEEAERLKEELEITKIALRISEQQQLKLQKELETEKKALNDLFRQIGKEQEKIHSLEKKLENLQQAAGYLELKEENGKWLKVWVKLIHRYLYYFNNKVDGVLLGYVDLLQATIHDPPRNSSGNKYCFELAREDNNESWIFAAKTLHSKNAWLSSFETIGGRERSATAPDLRMIDIASDPQWRVDANIWRKSSVIASKTTSQPELPELESLSLLLKNESNPHKNSKRHSLKAKIKKFGSLNVRTFGKLYTEPLNQNLLLEEIGEKWNKPLEKLGVWTDFPRVSKNVKCFEDIDGCLEIIEIEKGKTKTKKASSWSMKRINSSVYDENLSTKKRERSLIEVLGEGGDDFQKIEETEIKDSKNKVKLMERLLLIFSYKLEELEIFSIIKKKFSREVHPEKDVPKEIKNFFTFHAKLESKTLRLLKVLTQAVLAPPYITLRNKFNAVDLPITDVHLWLIEVIFRKQHIIVVHSKKARSVSQSPENSFEFVWHIQITLDKALNNIQDSRLSLTDLEISDRMDKAKKKKIKNIVQHHLYL